MKGLPFVLLFTAMTFFSWGAYGPTLHHGSLGLEHDSMRAFVAVGLAYFMIAVLIPFFVLQRQGEKGKWTVVGVVYSFFAGAVGAVGALGIILALAYGGRPVYVMPLVFGFAPVVNTLMTALLSRTFDQIKPVFLGGVVATALGAAGVLVFKPSPPASPAKAEAAEESAAAVQLGPITSDPTINFVSFSPQNAQRSLSTDAPANSETETAQDEPVGEDATSPRSTTSAGSSRSLGQAEAESPPAELQAEEGPGDATTAAPATDGAATEPGAESTESDSTDAAENAEQDAAGGSTEAGETQAASGSSLWGIIASIVIAAMCWGSYGPFLHIGQGKMDGSRLRPFACVGMAYFFIAVAVPIVIIYSRPEDLGAWNPMGMTWSFAAGVLGAIGALGVILAFNAGGKPYYVMPLIFGFAPVVNTFISLTETDTWSLVSIWFYLSLAVVIGGAVTVLTNAPKPKPKPAAV